MAEALEKTSRRSRRSRRSRKEHGEEIILKEKRGRSSAGCKENGVGVDARARLFTWKTVKMWVGAHVKGK
jgi:hypothetical protein